MSGTLFRRILFVAPPIVALLLDFAVSPTVFEARQLRSKVNVASLVTDQAVLLGTLKAHHLYVSIDDIRATDFLSRLRGQNTGLVVSAYVYEDGSFSGALIAALLGELARDAPEVERTVRDQLSEHGAIAPGRVLPIGLDLPRAARQRFPVTRVFVLGLAPGKPNSATLAQGLRKVFSAAESADISNLIVPCLGTNWSNKNSLTFDEFFGPLFEALPLSDKPGNIYLSLYTEWPTFELEHAVTSLNAAWDASFQTFGSSIPLMYRLRLRLTLLFLSLCLLASSFYASLSVRNFMIISASFVATALSCETAVDFFAQGYGPTFRFLLQTGLLAVVALGFPFVVDWNPRRVFGN